MMSTTSAHFLNKNETKEAIYPGTSPGTLYYMVKFLNQTLRFLPISNFLSMKYSATPMPLFSTVMLP